MKDIIFDVIDRGYIGRRKAVICLYVLDWGKLVGEKVVIFLCP